MENKKNINKKSFDRLIEVQILYSYLNQKDDEENINDLFSFLEEYYISEEFSDNEEEYRKNVNKNFLNELLDGVVEHFDAIDLLLEKNLTGKYTFNVIDNLIKVILRLAMYEFNYTNTDKNVIINEYVDIAGEYFDDKAISFVNAILDKLSKVKS